MGIASRILQIERCAEKAWPALREETLAGWRLRFADGFTRRSNSVQPFLFEGRGETHATDRDPPGHGSHHKPEAIGERIALCEAKYQAVGLAAIFRISPLNDTPALAEMLSGRGYRQEGETVVMTRGLSTRKTLIKGKGPVFDDPLSPRALPALIRLTGTLDHHQHTYTALIERALPPRTAAHTAALLSGEGGIVCCGRGVVGEGWLGVFDVATETGLRRQGLAALLMDGLMEWGREHGAASAYLQVEATNAAALRLYGRLGFEALYRYVYWGRRG